MRASRSWRQQLGEDDPVDREEERYLHGQPDQDHEAAGAGDGPQCGVTVEVQDQRVGDLVRQSISQKASPASTTFQFARSISTAYT